MTPCRHNRAPHAKCHWLSLLTVGDAGMAMFYKLYQHWCNICSYVNSK